MRKNSRLYHDTKWIAARSRYLAEHPHCLGCQAIGQQAQATVIDHIIPHFGNVARFWDVANWQPCCDWHHNSIKATLEKKWLRAELQSDALALNSVEAIALTRRRWRVAIAIDGWPMGG